MTPVRPEILAAKLQAIRNLEYPRLAKQLFERPRLVEMLWFIQFQSAQPGGLETFVDRLIEQFPDRFVRESMLEVGLPKEGRYTPKQCLEVWQTEMRLAPCSWLAPSREFNDWACLSVDQDASFEDVQRRRGERHNIEFGLKNFNYSFFAASCRRKAREVLPHYLASLCEESQGFEGARYCPDLIQTIFDFMDLHAGVIESGLAKTAVSQRVFRELGFSLDEKVPVVIVGESRFGKTKSVATWCQMRPGRARLVTVPPGNSERDFYAAHADAFGLAYTEKTSCGRLKAEVEFIHRHGGLFYVYDEAHFLVPENCTKTTAPRRLNWVRCEIIDRGFGCAFFATPQTYKQTLDQFCKTTGYRMEQWLGRMAPAVLLPADLDREDLIAVAQKNFPEIPGPLLTLICARAIQTEGYLKSIELTAKRARYLSRENGHREVTLTDIDQAISDMMPLPSPATISKRAQQAPSRVAAAPLQTDCKKPTDVPSGPTEGATILNGNTSAGLIRQVPANRFEVRMADN